MIQMLGRIDVVPIVAGGRNRKLSERRWRPSRRFYMSAWRTLIRLALWIGMEFLNDGGGFFTLCIKAYYEFDLVRIALQIP